MLAFGQGSKGGASDGASQCLLTLPAST